MAEFKLHPSILSADFSQLDRQIHEVESCGADGIHIDVMDGHFVPSITFGTPIIKAVRGLSHLPLDIHMMTTGEIVAEKYKITRERADEFAYLSHQKAIEATDRGELDNEISINFNINENCIYLNTDHGRCCRPLLVVENNKLLLTLPVLTKGHLDLKISDIKINNNIPWQRKHFNSIKLNYSKSKFFNRVFPWPLET